MALLDCYLPVFKKIILMSGEHAAYPEYDSAREACIDALETAMQRAAQQDACEQEKEAARLAVIAWMDETILCSLLPWRQQWQGELLQRKYLNITIGGERFFSELEQLEVTWQQARKVFLFCLHNGFHGQYGSPDDKAALLGVIAQQRKLLLPEAWHQWPCAAAITPCSTEPPAVMSLHKRPLFNLTVAVTLLYGAVFLSLSLYIN
ncbi:type IV secretion protein DotU [Mangrovibacter phragmitis]|uniref:Type IV secretion protein DotU n=1 Tax=Mangrovibacter phragmitis TaxID=1691903 RepID=A0A1B7L295_9ENTR|nr:DotU family type IV/VI secretion system protein [Mangrovibacter phragmitis]OAT76514.1 type IV secretion protein DotU [Mangrovibacter phragmitis]